MVCAEPRAPEPVFLQPVCGPSAYLIIRHGGMAIAAITEKVVLSLQRISPPSKRFEIGVIVD